jgi:hypothetical protein
MIRGTALLLMLIAAPAMAQEKIQLKPGPGHDTTASSCSVCHTLAYIPMNSVFLNKSQWKAEVSKMRNAFGAPIDDQMEAEIVDYLAAAYGVPEKKQ